MIPTRIQRRRTKGWRMPADTVSVCRPGPFGNPFGVHPDEGGAAAAVRLYSEWIRGDWPGTEPQRRRDLIKKLPTLRGKNLACFCPLDQPCHADVLLDLANPSSSVAIRAIRG